MRTPAKGEEVGEGIIGAVTSNGCGGTRPPVNCYGHG